MASIPSGKPIVVQLMKPFAELWYSPDPDTNPEAESHSFNSYILTQFLSFSFYVYLLIHYFLFKVVSSLQIFLQNLQAFLFFPRACCIPHPHLSHLIYYPSNIWWSTVTKVFVSQFFQLSRHFFFFLFVFLHQECALTFGSGMRSQKLIFLRTELIFY
jgi:hypothetical protein